MCWKREAGHELHDMWSPALHRSQHLQLVVCLHNLGIEKALHPLRRVINVRAEVSHPEQQHTAGVRQRVGQS